MNPRPDLLVLGAGPAGLWAALRWLRAHPGRHVVVVDRDVAVGGLCGGFQWRGRAFDYGSHRLHPATDPALLQELAALLDCALHTRPRNGRIRLAGRWLRFPLRPVDLLRALPPGLAVGLAADMATGPLRRERGDSYAHVLRAGVGPTLSARFYEPYARKLWGLEPTRLDGDQARRRVAARSGSALLSKLVRGRRAVFHYPNGGFGRLCEAMAAELESLGARLLLETRPQRLEPGRVRLVDTSGATRELEPGFVLSTIPVDALVEALEPAPPAAVLEATAALRTRGMVFLYLELSGARYTPYDAHYFPGPEVPFSRTSELAHYDPDRALPDRTDLCVELPCAVGDALWRASLAEIEDRVVAGLETCGLPSPTVLARRVERRPAVYPVHDLGQRARWRCITDHLGQRPGIAHFGRHGSFLHDNLHHALELAQDAASCLDAQLRWDQARWASCLERAQRQVVVD